MKVKVRCIVIPTEESIALNDIDVGRTAMQRVWIDYVNGLTTEQLQRICRVHAHKLDEDILPFELLLPVMAELSWRRQADNPDTKTAEQAYAEFHRHYRPETPPKLTPSPGGKECLGNGEWPGYACCCDECDDYQTCFPGWFPGARWDVELQKWV